MNIIQAYTYIESLFRCQKPLLIVGFTLAFFSGILTKFLEILNTKDLTIPLVTIVILAFFSLIFILADLITGMMKAKRDKKYIKSQAFGKTVAKLFGLFLYLAVAFIVVIISTNMIVMILVYAPIFLSILKEYISIGENLEKLYGSKSYIFTIMDKIFDILEGKFFDKLKE